MKAIVTILLVFSCAATARSGNNHDSTNRLTAVWEGSSYLLATTSYGLMRASVSEKKWTRLTPPISMPLQGSFGRVPSNSDFVLFVALGADSNKVAGIYISRDKGTSWKLLSKDHKFTRAYVTEDGTLYALAVKSGTWSPSANQVFMSTNHCKTWRDLSAGIKGLDIYGIIPDPDHTNLVCLLGSGIRGYVLQADDAGYQWKWTAEFVWKQNEPNDERFFRSGDFWTTWIAYVYLPTLENYFDYDFGGKTETCAFRLLTDRKSYTFEKEETKKIQAKIVLYPDELKVKLVDFDRGAEVWSVKIKTPDTNYVTSMGQRKQPGDKLKKRSDFKLVELTAGTPYERMIDLGSLFEFKQKGKYIVQLIYNSGGIADRGLEEWPGGFSSQPFEVVVK